MKLLLKVSPALRARHWPLPQLVAALTLVCATAAAGETPILASSAYREFFDVSGQNVAPDAAMIGDSQQRLLTLLHSRLSASGNTGAQAEIATREKLIQETVSDGVLANGLVIDELLSSSGTEDDSRLRNLNAALRNAYLTDIAPPTFSLPAGTFTKGIPPSLADALEEAGIGVYKFTDASGSAYVNECSAAGVPIPPTFFQAPWVNQGSFDGSEFISSGLDPELWVYESTSPPGVCLALPRYNASDEAELLGIICLGTESSNACFWDNPRGVRFPRDVPIPLSSFLGGADLADNGQGTCTACHPGENPFNIHPEVAAFAGVSPIAQPAAWHRPLVDPSWPQNPGPTNLLDSVASTRSCTGCHQAGVSGRFPEMSTEIAQYCSSVLTPATRERAPRPAYFTMPMGDAANGAQYENHITALLDACEEPPPSGTEDIPGGLTPDASFVSRPIIVEPLYACATRITVRSTLLDAAVAIYVDGVEVANVISRNPDELAIDLPNPLVAGQTLTATQKLAGALSAPSPDAVVRDHTLDYPTGLPAPTIDPTLIYECGNPIAVRHVPGATVTTWVNSADARTSNGGGTGWTVFYPGVRPFGLGDKYTAQQSLCTDTSPVSNPEVAVAAPAAIAPPRLNPATVYTNQELVGVEAIVNGSQVQINETVVGPLRQFYTPISWAPNVDIATPLGRPLQAGDSLNVEQTLCGPSGPSVTVGVKECEDLPPPEIRRPVVGSDEVIVTSAVPGARIVVFDDAGVELGDGSGTVILLNRAIVAGDRLTVIQYLGSCTGQLSYFATAIEASAMAVSKSQSDTNSGATTNSAQLQVTVANTKATLGTVDVCFYKESDQSVIGCDYGVAEGATATFSWQNLASDTEYRWFARAVDVEMEQSQSATFAFTTQAATPAPVPTQPLTLMLLTSTLLYLGWRWPRR